MKAIVKVEYYNLLHRLFDGEISDIEMIKLKSWLEQDPENIRIFDEENELWQETSFYLNNKIYKTDKAWKNISSRLGIGKQDFKILSFLGKNNFRLLIAAASLTIILGIGGINNWISEKTSLKQLAKTKIVTLEREKAHLILSDSTEIVLNSGSTLQYDDRYNVNSREVFFTGEAFFNVKTNPKKPFVVELNGMKVSATGTQFNICSFDNDDRIETTLEEGKIQVSINGMKPLNLKSGQQAVYYIKSKNVLVHEVSSDTYSSWKENKLRFIECPLEEVLRIVGRNYNVEFEIINKDILNLKFTATILDESIEEVMQMLSTVSAVTFKIKASSLNNDVKSVKTKIILEMKKAI